MFLPFKRSLTLPWLALLLAASYVQAEAPDVEDEVFARVGSSVILVSEYRQALRQISRNTFYHRTPPESELLAFQKDVADQIIERELLLQAAAKQGLEIDKAELEKELDKHRDRALRKDQEVDEQSEHWQSVRLRSQHDLLVEKLENDIRQSTAHPSEDELRSYYNANIDKFTEPGRFDLSIILLGVASSAGSEVWDAALQEAEDIVSRLRAGADFAELARTHSTDVSAEDGGKLGYVHKGMFNDSVQEMIEQLSLDEISEPFQTLDGYVVLRLNNRQDERRMEFSQIRERAQELWLREAGERQWQDYLQQLRKNSNIKIAEEYLTISGRDGAVPDNLDEY